MSRVLEPSRFVEWVVGAIGESLPIQLREVATVTDRSDGQLSHLDGLNLSRAWNMKAIAAALPASSLSEDLREAAERHLRVGLEGLRSGDYMGEHWLASFALLALE